MAILSQHSLFTDEMEHKIQTKINVYISIDDNEIIQPSLLFISLLSLFHLDSFTYLQYISCTCRFHMT